MKISTATTLAEKNLVLRSSRGKTVQIENEAYTEGDAGQTGHIEFQLSGTLEEREDDDGWLVRVKEGRLGASVISFWPQHVSFFEKLTNGELRIVLL